jgi:tetratricopeptide (TPR) repeat protein
LTGHRSFYEQAHALLEEGLQLCRMLGAPRRQWVNQLINVGWFALHQQDFGRARAALEEYLAEDSGKTSSGIASAHDSLGLVALYEGDREDAARRFRQAIALAREAGAKRTMAAALYGLAAVAAIDGDAERSTRLWSAADASGNRRTRLYRHRSSSSLSVTWRRPRPRPPAMVRGRRRGQRARR